MITVSVINLKGGVGKTITSTNLAYNLAARHKKVLIIDNDKQGNTSKFFNRHSYDCNSLSDLLLDKADIEDIIVNTEYDNLDIIPANMTLLNANKAVLLDALKPQHIRIREALEQVSDYYDYVIIDNAPDINISVINALVASDQVIIPVKIDKYSFDGIEEIQDQMNDIRKYYNSKLKFMGCLVTSFKNNPVNNQGVAVVRSTYQTFDTLIRWTDKVDESTFTSIPISEHSKRSNAAKDYISFTEEFLKEVEHE